jgi:hypothetical protein
MLSTTPFLPGYDDIAGKVLKLHLILDANLRPDELFCDHIFFKLLKNMKGVGTRMCLVMVGWICQGMTSGAANRVKCTWSFGDGSQITLQYMTFKLHKNTLVVGGTDLLYALHRSAVSRPQLPRPISITEK